MVLLQLFLKSLTALQFVHHFQLFVSSRVILVNVYLVHIFSV